MKRPKLYTIIVVGTLCFTIWSPAARGEIITGAVETYTRIGPLEGQQQHFDGSPSNTSNFYGNASASLSSGSTGGSVNASGSTYTSSAAGGAWAKANIAWTGGDLHIVAAISGYEFLSGSLPSQIYTGSINGIVSGGGLLHGARTGRPGDGLACPRGCRSLRSQQLVRQFASQTQAPSARRP